MTTTTTAAERNELATEIADAMDHGTLMDSDTAEEIGPATAGQREASDAAGPEGHIYVDEDGSVVEPRDREQAIRTRGATLRRVYVQP